jgi:hypothetical protein
MTRDKEIVDWLVKLEEERHQRRIEDLKRRYELAIEHLDGIRREEERYFELRANILRASGNGWAIREHPSPAVPPSPPASKNNLVPIMPSPSKVPPRRVFTAPKPQKRHVRTPKRKG